MKKLLFAFTSFALATSAFAQEGADIKWNAEMRFRFTNTENTPTAKSSNDNQVDQRNKIGATLTKGDDLTATVTLLNAATWGTEGSAGSTGGSMADDNDNDSGLYVYEAFALWKAMDNLALKVGRSSIEIADGSVVSKNDWEQEPTSSESLSATYFTEWANIAAIGVRAMNDTFNGTNGDTVTNTNDIEYYGLMFDFKNLPEALKLVNLHALVSKASGLAAGTIKDSKTRIGLTVKGDVSGFDYRGTYAMYNGENENTGVKTDHKASMYDVELGYTLADLMNMRFHVLYHSDTGEKTGGDITRYDPFFYEKHNNAGKMDIIGWGNLTYLKAGIALEPVEMTKVGVDYYMFTRTEKGDNTYGQAGAAGGYGSIIAAGATNDDEIGSEIDVWATKMLSNGTELNARIGMFQAGDAFGAAKEDVTQASLGATFRF